jgi:hypothetical protein
MPPRRSARAAAATERVTTALSPLPHAVVLHIFSLLPVDCRLRCAEVCRGWRSVLLERSLWTRLELTAASGVRVHTHAHGAWDALLRCAAARARGGLRSIQIDTRSFTHPTLLEVAAANARALRELHVSDDDRDSLGVTPDEATALLYAAPLLRTFTTDLQCEDDGMDVHAVDRVLRNETVRRALRNEEPFAPLRLRRLRADLVHEDEAGLVAFAADVTAHASLVGLTLEGAPLGTPAALDAVVDAALVRRLQHVELYDCGLSPESAPALARLLGGGALTALDCWHMQLADELGSAAVLAAALRASSTLVSLTLIDSGVFNTPAVAAELLGALTGHASVRTLRLTHHYVHGAHRAAAGATLGALVAANAPALTELDVSFCNLGSVGLRPLLEALPANAHLRVLDCSRNDISDAFARDVLLPAVRANTSLRRLHAGPNRLREREAEDIMGSRAAW